MQSSSNKSVIYVPAGMHNLFHSDLSQRVICLRILKRNFFFFNRVSFQKLTFVKVDQIWNDLTVIAKLKIYFVKKTIFIR